MSSTVPNTRVDARRWWALAAIALAQLLVVLDATIVNIALPRAQAELGMSDGQRQWVITAYVLAFGALLLLGGRVADYWGRKRSFIVGMAAFGLASLWGGLAQSGMELIIARGVQGAAAALLAPAALSLLTITFPSGKERGTAFAVFGTVSATGAATGLALGGVLTEFAGWRWCLLVNIVLAVFVLAGALVLPSSKAEGANKYDFAGLVVVVLGLGSLVFGFTQAENGWANPVVIGCIVAGVLLLGLFVWIESRVRQPLLPLRVVRNRTRAGAFLIQAIVGAVYIGTTVFIAFHLQTVLGLGPLLAGVGNLAMTGATLLLAPVAAQMFGKFGPRLVMTIGPLVAAVGMFLMSRLTADGNYWSDVFPGLILVGIGMAFLFVPIQNVALTGVNAHDAGAASAVVNSAMQIGGSIGLAVMTSIFVTVGGGHAAQGTADIGGYSAVYLTTMIALVLAAVLAATMIRTPAASESTTTEQTPVITH